MMKKEASATRRLIRGRRPKIVFVRNKAMHDDNVIKAQEKSKKLAKFEVTF